jgi:6-phosphogluconate dehydrogenase
MRIGFFGLGKMGSQMVERLLADGHQVVIPDRNPETVAAAVAQGAEKAADYQAVIKALGDKPVVWIMIPADTVDAMVDHLCQWLPAGAVVVDGGNSDYRLTQKRAAKLAEHKIDLVDVGTSGGILGLKNGFSMMAGGKQENYQHIEPLLKSLAHPGGYSYFGPVGAGHFVKMVHNGIEYGMMQSYADGYRVLKEGPYKELDLAKAAHVWQNASVIESKLNELIAGIFDKNPELEGSEGVVAESGEARWTLETAEQFGIDTPAITAAFEVRLASQKGQVNFGTKLLALLRNAFGGHAVNKDK